MMTSDLKLAIEEWLTALNHYDLKMLLIKPEPGKWSMGQLYMHLIESTDHFIQQARLCMSTNNHFNEESSPEAKNIFLHNGLPDTLIEGPPSNDHTAQPTSREQIREGIGWLQKEIAFLDIKLKHTIYKGKTRHPGLGYFNAEEWIKFAAMHLRHHLRQKKRVDEFLKQT